MGLRDLGLNFAAILGLQFELLTMLSLPTIQKQAAGQACEQQFANPCCTGILGIKTVIRIAYSVPCSPG